MVGEIQLKNKLIGRQFLSRLRGGIRPARAGQWRKGRVAGTSLVVMKPRKCEGRTRQFIGIFGESSLAFH